MNKFKNQGKAKLKTLPNQIGTHHQQFLFQSQCDEDYMKKIVMASPTFATAQLGLADQNHNDKTMRVNQVNQMNKENRISLCLKQYKNDDNINSSGKQNNLQFMKGQNQKLVEKCTNFQNLNKKLQEQNKNLKEKLHICKTKIKDKLDKLIPYAQMRNSSPDQDNVDIYIQLQVFISQYKMYKDESERLLTENQKLLTKIQTLEAIITNYTQKSEQKKLQKEDSSQKIIKMQKMYIQKLQQIKRKNELKLKESQTLKIEQQKVIKKLKDEYQKLKFLKEEIEKKRQEDLQCRQQLQSSLKQKEESLNFLKAQLIKYQAQYKTAMAKLASYSQNSQDGKQKLIKSNEELQLSLRSLQVESNKHKHSAENYKLLNQKYHQQIISLRKQNQQFFENFQSLKLQKDKLECIIQKYASNEERQTKRINELQQKISENQKQMQDIRVQFEQWQVKNSSRSHPNISKFKQQEEESQKQITSRGSESQKYAINSERIKKIQQQFNAIIQNLNKEIQELRKIKENLQSQLFSQREKFQKINLELQNTYRKIEQFNCNQCDRDVRDKNLYLKKGDAYGTSTYSFELTRATKAAPQLRMIKQILIEILNHRDTEEQVYRNSTNAFRQKDRDHFASIEDLIEDIKNLAEETADFFDDQDKQIQNLVRRIKHKQQVISKLLRFTPQQKKACILDYLKVMQAYEDYPIEQVYKVTRILEEEASEWKRNVNNLIDTAQKNQQEVLLLRKQVNRYKSDGGIRKHEPTIGNGDRFQKFQKQRHQRYPQKWQYQRKRY